MMKKIIFTFISSCVLAVSFNAQTNTTTATSTTAATPTTTTVASSTNAVDVKEANFDKKFRFGIRATPQPTWFKSGDNNSKSNGSTFGFGFGLIMEFKLSKIIHFTTGIGGDFEGGKISYRNDNEFNVSAVMNSSGDYVEAKNGVKWTDYVGKDNVQYTLASRQYKATIVTIPLLLKMMTDEYSGLRYFANAGLELGIRAGLKGTDTYVNGLKTTSSPTLYPNVPTTPVTDLVNKNLNINKDGSLVPVRVGMNLGLGTEYRIAGSTSLMFSVNYFQSFTNLMRNNSKYLVNGVKTSYSGSDGTLTFNQLGQSYLMRAIRINIGILF